MEKCKHIFKATLDLESYLRPKFQYLTEICEITKEWTYHVGLDLGNTAYQRCIGGGAFF